MLSPTGVHLDPTTGRAFHLEIAAVRANLAESANLHHKSALCQTEPTGRHACHRLWIRLHIHYLPAIQRNSAASENQQLPSQLQKSRLRRRTQEHPSIQQTNCRDGHAQIRERRHGTQSRARLLQIEQGTDRKADYPWQIKYTPWVFV